MANKIRSVDARGELSGIAQVSYLLAGVPMIAKIRHEERGQRLFCPRCGLVASALVPTALRGLVCEACSERPTNTGEE